MQLSGLHVCRAYEKSREEMNVARTYSIANDDVPLYFMSWSQPFNSLPQLVPSARGATSPNALNLGPKPLDGMEKDVTVQKVLSFFGALQRAPMTGGGGGGAGGGGAATLRMSLEELPLMSPQQVWHPVAGAAGRPHGA
eukprot:350333-Chlamydomonas_euryale.AAC.1